MVLDLAEIPSFVRAGVYYVKMFRIEYKPCMNSSITLKKSYCYDDKQMIIYVTLGQRQTIGVPISEKEPFQGLPERWTCSIVTIICNYQK